MASIKACWKSFAAWYVRFVERQGFMIILAVCVGVIAGTAVWTNQADEPAPVPTPPVNEAASVAQLLQQSLRDAATPTPAPTAMLQTWQAPLESISVLRAFDGARMVQSGVTGLWQLHDAADLRCAAGDPVYAMSDGTVVSVSAKGLMGASVTIDHGNGILVQYAGMALHAGLRQGDPVAIGQTIGFAGNGVVDESDLEPHLHLRVTRDGSAIDPLSLLRN